jgi:hypothetical protein
MIGFRHRWQPNAGDGAAAPTRAQMDLHVVGDGELAGDGKPESRASSFTVA